MIKPQHGVVHGRTIELSEALPLADGQEVEITIKLVPPKRPWGEGLRRSAGALAQAWSAEDDRILATIQDERRQDQRGEPGE